MEEYKKVQPDPKQANKAEIDQQKKFCLEKEISLIQVPHHGADDHCSTDELVDFLSPKAAVISSHKNETRYFHPRRNIIQRYLGHLRDGINDGNREVFSWTKVEIGHQFSGSNSDKDRPQKEWLKMQFPGDVQWKSISIDQSQKLHEEVGNQVVKWAKAANIKNCTTKDGAINTNGSNFYRCEEDTAKEIYQTATHNEPFIFKPENS